MPATTNETRPGQTALPIEPPVVYGSEGSYVGLETRAEHLLVALEALGRRNQRFGFDTASNDRSYNRPIRERYAGALPAVQLGAEDNAENFEEQAKRSLWRATGYIALRNARPRLATKGEINGGARKMWRDFEHAYGHTSTRKERDRYKRRLARTLKWCGDMNLPAAA